MLKRFANACLLLVARVAYRLPLTWALWLGRCIGALAAWVSRRHMRHVSNDIALAFPTITQRETRRIARAMYRRLGESLMEFLRLPYQTKEEIGQWLTLEGTEYLDEVIRRGKGAVLVGAHLGNWELCATALCLHGYRISAITKSQRDTAFTALINRTRNQHGLTVLEMDDLRAVLRALKRNECIGNICDLNAKQPAAFVTFMGRPAATYSGAAFFALATGASILAVYDEPQSDGKHIVRIHPPITVLETGDRQRDLFYNTLRVHHAIEREIRRRPQDWYWLVRRWRTSPEEIVNPESVPMEHRDLSQDEVARILDTA